MFTGTKVKSFYRVLERGSRREEAKSEEETKETSDSSPNGVAEVERENESEHSEGVSEGNTEETPQERPGVEPLTSRGCRKAFTKWRPYAWQTAATLGVAAVTLFSVYTSAFDTEGTSWKVCVGIVTLLLLGAGVAFLVFVHDFFCTGNEDEQRDEPPLDADVP